MKRSVWGESILERSAALSPNCAPEGGRYTTPSIALQQRPNLKNIFQVFKVQQFVNEASRLRGTEDGNDEIARFCDYLFAVHWIFRSAADGFDALGQLGSVVQGNLDNGHALGDQFFQFLVADELDFGAQSEDFRVLHTGLVVGRFERSGFVDDHDRNHVLQANIRHLAVVYGIGGAGRVTHDDLLHLVRLKAMLFHDELQGVQRRLDRAAGRPSLQRGHRHFVPRAEAIDHFFG